MDYERYGRQIALAELGVDGQAKLASRSVRFVGERAVVELAQRLWTHAGGVLPNADATPNDPVSAVVEIAVERVSAGDAPAAMAAASWAALAAMRALLGWPAHTPSKDLAALFSGDRQEEHTSP
jgi:hypothetical protein